MSHELLLILDYGSQFTQLIARRARELGVYAEIVDPRMKRAEIQRRAPRGIVLSGGPMSVLEEGAVGLDEGVLSLGIPVLGICYGFQLLARDLGGRVAPSQRREYGEATLAVETEGRLLAGVEHLSRVWASHGDVVESMPRGFTRLAHTDSVEVAAVEDPDRGV
ncbi:MAG TPA: glutamine-hydrolyzing GMP synthase, partial [Candidatus Binatia bacterium]|nr:glutamine-hydrolyzing GMP synthase [Candidatus Binatia bacterium]